PSGSCAKECRSGSPTRSPAPAYAAARTSASSCTSSPTSSSPRSTRTSPPAYGMYSRPRARCRPVEAAAAPPPSRSQNSSPSAALLTREPESQPALVGGHRGEDEAADAELAVVADPRLVGARQRQGDVADVVGGHRHTGSMPGSADNRTDDLVDVLTGPVLEV